MNEDEMIIDIANVLDRCCNEFDDNGAHIRNLCGGCEFWNDDNSCCCSYNRKEATALYNAGYRKVADDEIVVKKREYEQLKKHNRDRKRLRLRWQQAKQETKDILQELYDYCKEDVYGQVTVDFNCLETLARKYDIELED